MELQENSTFREKKYHVHILNSSKTPRKQSIFYITNIFRIFIKSHFWAKTLINRFFKDRNSKQNDKSRFVASLAFLLIFVFSSTTAYAASKLTAESSKSQQISSGRFLLAPVSVSAAANPQSSLTLLMSAKNDYFYLKNFGTYSIRYFTMTQTLASTTIRYCVNQNFRGGSYTRCNDNSNALVVGSSLALGRQLFSTPLGIGTSYHFSAVSTISGNNIISVSISQNDLLTPGGTIYNS